MHYQNGHTSKKRKDKIMIIEKIIIDLASFLQIDASKIEQILQNVKKNTYLYQIDIREFSSIGIPIISTISGVLGISGKQVFELARYDKEKHTGNITYQDTILILGIIAQDFKLRSQVIQ